MVSTRHNSVGGLAVAAAVPAISAFLLLGCASSTPEPESVSVPSEALATAAPSPSGEAVPDGPESTVPAPAGEDAVQESAPSVDDPPTTESNTASDSESTVKPPAKDPLDGDPEFAVEIIEELAPAEAAGGARQEDPLEPIESEESDGTGDSGRQTSAPGETYTWHDGDRILEAVLQPDLTVIGRDAAVSGQDGVGDTGQGRIVTRRSDDAQGVKGASGAQGAEGSQGTIGPQPVFLSESGELMTLPGGVILVLDEDWDSDATDGFFARNGISLDRVSELDYLTNGFLIETQPGFLSLELANALATQSGVDLSSPNWSRERTAR